MTSTITEVLNDSLENVAQSLVSKGEIQKIEMTQESNLSKFKSEVESSPVVAYLASDNLFHNCISILEWYSVSSFTIYWLSIVSGVIGKLFSFRSSHNIFSVFPIEPNFRIICDDDVIAL